MAPCPLVCQSVGPPHGGPGGQIQRVDDRSAPLVQRSGQLERGGFRDGRCS